MERTGSTRRSNPTKVSLLGVRKTFSKDEAAVNIKDWEIQPSEFVTLVGPSGCGKTTTMRMIAGLEEPTEGDIRFGDRSVVDVSIQRRNVSMVFQNYALYPHMRIADNLDYGLRKRGVPRAERHERVSWVAKLLGIDQLLDRKPRQLSGGEQQRVALGRALIRTPDVLLLDEPLSNLDAKLRTFMRAELVKLQRQIGCTTIFVTHDQLEAMTMSDRIAVMNKGVLQQFATPFEIYDRPANLFVAGFIGSPPMNFIGGEATVEGGGHVFVGNGIRLPLPAEIAGGIERPADRHVVLGIRPEHLLLGNVGGDFTATVSLVELIGAEKYVFLAGDVGEMIARVAADSPVRAGERVACTLLREKIRPFAAGEGVALGRTPAAQALRAGAA
jgi:multiple sugar transport system ATP-binding protein